jgi:cell division protein FtsB
MRRIPPGLAVTAFCLGLLGYFAWHGMEGPRSFDNYKRLQAKIAALDADLEKAQKQRIAFDRHAELLRPENIDPDMVDELARKTLGFAAEGELVVIEGPRNDAPPRP